MGALPSSFERTPELAADGELLDRVKRGDQQALADIYDRYSKYVYSVAIRILGNPSAAEDVVQEIFMQLWTSPMKIWFLNGTLHGWLATASRNRAISLRRKRSNESLDDLVLISPHDFRKGSEQRMECQALIGQLEQKQQTLLHMAFVEELTHMEIAATTGYPLGTIKTKIRSALSILRKDASA